MELAIPKIKTNIHSFNKAWNESLTRLRCQVRRARRNYQRCGIYNEQQILLTEYRNLKNTYRMKITEVKEKSWQKFVESNLQTDMWGIPYKIVSQKIKSPTLLSTLKKNDETMTETWEESAKLLLQELLPPDNIEEDSQEQTVIREEMLRRYTAPQETQTEPFTMEEIADFIHNMKKKKAPGPDRIPAEVIQALQEKLTPLLCTLYNECLRQGKIPQCYKISETIIIKKGEDKDPKEPKSYRPICLLNTLGKIQEKLLCSRLKQQREISGLNQNQYGYRKGRSTEDAINRALEIIDSSNEKYVIAIFIDISGAFDNLWWPALFSRLRQLDCPTEIYKSFRNYCQDRYTGITSPTGCINKLITRGCPQGSVCGPVFWDIVLEELLENLTASPAAIGTVAYADDLLIILEAASRREIETKGNTLMEIINRWTTKVKLTVSTSKTTYVIMKGKLSRDPQIKYKGSLIRRSKQTRYLGIILDETRLYSNHITNVCERASATMHKIARLALKEYKLPFRQMKIHLDVILASIVGYGASVWAQRLTNCKNREKLDRTQRNFLVRMTGAFSTTPTLALTAIAGVMPLQLEIARRAATYWLSKGNHDRVITILGRRIATKREIRQEIERKQQEMWDRATTARRLYNFLPTLAEKPTHFNPSPGLVHFLTGHGPYPTYLHRFNLKETDRCDCEEMGTPEHIIFECNGITNVQEERNTLRNLNQNLNIAEILQDITQYETLNKLANKISKHLQEKYNEIRRRR